MTDTNDPSIRSPFGKATPPPGDAESLYAGFQREDLLRYARHFALPQVGPDGQRVLAEAKVLLVGAGGLGSPAALYLAAAGVGTLGIVDDDLVDLSNLQRQVLHGIDHLGRPKVESATHRLWSLNPNVQVVPHPVRLTGDNALDLFGQYQVVVDGSDNFPTRYLVNDAAVLSGLPYVYGAVDRWEGQVSVFGTRAGPCYRCLFREPPPPGMVPTCAEAGVLGVLPGIIGSLQAAEVVKLLLGIGESLAGRLLLFDSLAMRFREMRLQPHADCPVCGPEPTITEPVDYEIFCGVEPAEAGLARDPVPILSPRQLADTLEGDDPPFLLDVREPYEWEIGNLAGKASVLIPYGEVRARLSEIPRDRPVVVLCHVGVRSAIVANVLRAEGFTEVYNLRGGYLAWIDDIEPNLPRY
jgi:adenylyltransferase/sulfurtransferase